MSKFKMYCIYAKDSVKAMNGNRGKLASMAGHAFLHSYWDAEEKAYLNRYSQRNSCSLYKQSEKAFKITLAVDTTEELIAIHDEIKSNIRFGSSLVKDSAITVFEKPTVVCLGVGPIAEEDVPESIKKLRVFI